MIRFLFSLVALLVLATPNLTAQTVASSRDATTAAPHGQTSRLPAGKTVKDSKGRTVTNDGTNENGGANITYTGKLDRTTTPWTVTGEITVVTNPSSQGSNGGVTVGTNGEPTTVNLNKDGSPQGTQPGPLNSTISGGNATVNVNGNHNNFTVNGNNNTTSVNGNNNTGSVNGNGATPNNTVNMGGQNNSVTSGGTTFRN